MNTESTLNFFRKLYCLTFVIIVALASCKIKQVSYQYIVDNIKIEGLKKSVYIVPDSCNISYVLRVLKRDTLIPKKQLQTFRQLNRMPDEQTFYLAIDRETEKGTIKGQDIAFMFTGVQKINSTTWIKTDSLKNYDSDFSEGNNTILLKDANKNVLYRYPIKVKRTWLTLPDKYTNHSNTEFTFLNVDIEICEIAGNEHMLTKGTTNSFYFYAEVKDSNLIDQIITVKFGVRDNLNQFAAINNGQAISFSTTKAEYGKSKIIGPVDVYLAPSYPDYVLPLQIQIHALGKTAPLKTSPVPFEKIYLRKKNDK